jgi:hypothetical protein
MIRNLKALGLAFVAVFAMSAIAASAAQAVEFHAESAPAIIEGVQEAGHPSEFETSAGTISCSGATFTGTSATTTTPTLNINFSYTGCTFLNVLNVPVEPRGCHYVFHASGTVDVAGTNCAAEPIRFSALTCVVTVPPQENLEKVTFTNQGTGSERDVTVTPEVTGIRYNTSAGCSNGFHEGLTNGVYRGGQTTVKAFSEETELQVGAWVE